MTRHGVIKEYMVSVYCSDSSTISIPCDTRHVPGDRLYDRWTLANDQSYSVTVEAVTSAGRNTSLTLYAVTSASTQASSTLLAANHVRQFVAVRDRQSGDVSLSWLAPQSHAQLSLATPSTGVRHPWRLYSARYDLNLDLMKSICSILVCVLPCYGYGDIIMLTERSYSWLHCASQSDVV
jgi:hypothetical protein